METEITLLGVFLISLISLKIKYKEYRFAQAGRIGMAAMLMLTSIGHFMFTKGMVMMMPGFIPYRTAMVYFTGVIEMAAAIGLLIPRPRKITGYLLILFFILLLPINIYAAINHVDLEKATFDGEGINYLYYRVPLQLFFIGWVYLCAINPAKMTRQP